MVGFSNQIIKHITDGNDIEERLVTIMGGGVVLETLYEKLLREGRELGVEQGIEQGTIETLSTLVNDGILTLSEAAQRAGMTITDFKKKTEQLHPNM